MMVAVYGYPKSGRDLPGLVQIHGGGQYADYRAVLTNAVVIEHFGYFQSASKECVPADIQAMKKVDENGKIVVFEAWLGFAWIDREFMPLPLEKKREIAATPATPPFCCAHRFHIVLISKSQIKS